MHAAGEGGQNDQLPPFLNVTIMNSPAIHKRHHPEFSIHATMCTDYTLHDIMHALHDPSKEVAHPSHHRRYDITYIYIYIFMALVPGMLRLCWALKFQWLAPGTC